MSSIDYSGFRKRMIEAACRRKVEDTMRLTSELESEMITRINDLVGSFGRVEALALIAALDRYKAMVMDMIVQSGESRAFIQSCADELNESTIITYVSVKKEEEVNLDDN